MLLYMDYIPMEQSDEIKKCSNMIKMYVRCGEYETILSVETVSMIINSTKWLLKHLILKANILAEMFR